MFQKTKSKRNDPRYNSYWAMRKRCDNKNSPDWDNYGGRGITICDRWLGKEGFDNFLQDMGDKPTPKHTLDRIDVNGNYEPSNCRWLTIQDQQRNRRGNGHMYVYYRAKRDHWLILVRGKYLGVRKTLEQALELRDQYV